MSAEEYNGERYFGQEYFGAYFQTGAPVAAPQGPYFGPRFFGKNFYGHPYYGPGAIVPPPPPPPPPPSPATAGTSVVGGGGGSDLVISFTHTDAKYGFPPLPQLDPQPVPVEAPSRRKTGRGRLRPRHVPQPKRKTSPLSWIAEAPDPETQAAGAVLSVEEVERHWMPKAQGEALQAKLARALEELRAGEANVRAAKRAAKKAARRAERKAARAERRAAALAGLPAKVVYVTPGETWQPAARVVAWAGLGAGVGAGAGLLLPARPAWLRPAVVVVGALAGALFGLRR